MTSRKTIVLLIIFFGLLAYVYFFEIQGEKRKQAKKESEELLINLDKKQVNKLLFLPEGIVIGKDSTQWRVLSPVQTDADGSTVESILDDFSRLKKGRFVSDNPNDFKKFGLTPYQYALVIRQLGRIDTLLIGDSNLDNTNIFYRKSGSNHVYLVPITLKTNVTKSLFDLRDKAIIKFEKEEITKILIENNRQTFSCFKDKSQQWRLEKPIRTLCDEDKIDNILNELHNSRIKRFDSEHGNQLRKYELNDPWLTISLIDNSNRQQKTLFIGKKDRKEYYAKVESKPSIFLIDSSLVNDIDVSLFDLRDKTVVSFEQDSVTEILLQYPNFTFHCIKDSAKKWLITQPDSGLAKSWKISSLFYNIKDIKVAQFIDKPYKSDTFYGFDRLAIKLILKKENLILAELLVGKKVEEKIYLKNNLTNTIFMVKAKVKDNISVKTEEFLDKDN
jgi:hypothetical protein